MVILLLCLVVGLLGAISMRTVLGNLPEDLGVVESWQEAASRVELEVYAPTYRPGGEAESQIVVYEREAAASPDTPEGVSATYPSGLVISEFEVPPGPRVSPRVVQVKGAGEAYFDTLEGDRILVLRRGNTWVNLAGRPDSELLQVAESLHRVDR